MLGLAPSLVSIFLLGVWGFRGAEKVLNGGPYAGRLRMVYNCRTVEVWEVER